MARPLMPVIVPIAVGIGGGVTVGVVYVWLVWTGASPRRALFVALVIATILFMVAVGPTISYLGLDRP